MKRRHWWSQRATLAAATIVAASVALVIPGSSVTRQPTSPARPVLSVAAAQLDAPIYAGLTYVALGSSYAAGPERHDDVWSPCQRAADNYPHQVAGALGMRLVDVTCSGSRSVDILRPAHRGRHRQAQIESIAPETRLVTITTGGNDIDYVGRLFALGCMNSEVSTLHARTARLCSFGREAAMAPSPAAYAEVERSFVEIVEAVRARAPKALVVIIDYLPVVGPGARTCPALALTPAEASSTARIYDDLALATARAAAVSGAVLIAASKAGREHSVCSSSPWINGFGRGGVSYHPNAAGKTAMADLVLDVLRRPDIQARMLSSRVSKSTNVADQTVGAPSR